MDGTAADLSSRDHDLAAVLLKHPGRRGIGLGVHRVGHAAEEEGDAGPLGTDRRQDLGQPGPAPESRGSMAIIRRKVGGNSLVIPDFSAKSSKPSFWNSRAGASAVLTRPGVGKQVMQDHPLQEAGLRSGRRVFLHGDLERPDQRAILNARGTGRLAGPAIKAELQMPATSGPMPSLPSVTARIR